MATVAPATRLVFTAGACPLDADGRTVAPGDHVAQARQVMTNLETALRAAGATLTDVVKSTVYVASSEQADLVAVWQVVRDAFGDHDPPSTLLGVAVLGYRDQLVEVEAIAAVPAD
ncbi:RidA family protein [Micromonospora zingiberis]|uniref:RidA family protein n=1 Tax=Micromonospora zingiberis TaxID=2053011 RepID=A0A4R0GR72_9ACTN|nr:RidA family protein [Micromonospora zingiberis]TCB99103.1 RidA family protein [Micromonospora zingiberis]